MIVIINVIITIMTNILSLQQNYFPKNKQNKIYKLFFFFSKLVEYIIEFKPAFHSKIRNISVQIYFKIEFHSDYRVNYKIKGCENPISVEKGKICGE